MNYIGSISILDRGDAPAQAVIDRNARSLAQRIADETKDELEKVMTRVETVNIYIPSFIFRIPLTTLSLLLYPLFLVFK